MSLEAFHQSRPPEALPIEHEEFVVPPATSPCMEQAVTQLATLYAVDLTEQGALLSIDQPDQPRRWLIANIDRKRIGVTRCQVDEDDLLLPEIDIVFEVTPYGWAPRELVHSDRVWQTYLQAMQAKGEPVANANGDFNFAAFTDFMAQDLAYGV